MDFYISAEIPEQPMKIAVCFSSQLRGGVHAHPNIKSYLGEAYQDCVFFAHLWDINTRKPYVRTGNVVLPAVVSADWEDLKTFKELYNIQDFSIENYDEVKNHYTENNLHFYSLFYSWYKSLELLENYTTSTGEEFDLIVKLRPDIMFRPGRNFLKEVLTAFLKNRTTDVFLVENLVPDWNTTTHVNDVCWVSTPNLMKLAKQYFFENQQDNTKTFVNHLRNHSIKLGNLGYGYCCVKLECMEYAILQEYEKCFECEQFYFGP